MKFYPGVLIIFGLLLNTHAHARSCNSDEYDKADYFSSKAGMKIIDGYGGGKNQRIIMRSCDYNSYSQLFKVKVEVYWNGAVFGGNEYNVDGELSLNSSGGLVNFSKTYSNENLKELAFAGGVVGGAVLLGILLNESN